MSTTHSSVVLAAEIAAGPAHAATSVSADGTAAATGVPRQELTHERLVALLRYNPQSGDFTRRVSLTNSGRAGAPAGSIGSHGYLQISVAGRIYLAHRLAWFYMTGAWPCGVVDHKDVDRLNNRWSNLRDASTLTNNQNQRAARKNSRSGLLGTFRAGNRWKAQIKVNRKAIHLGSFATAQEAHAAYLAAKRHYHEGCTL
jgi:hypothetical protein